VTVTACSGIIVAGGRSTRFGERDKALVDLGGEPMIRRVADRVGAVVDELVVNCRAEQVGPIRRALDGAAAPLFAIDDVPDRGPVAGLAEGFRVANAPVAVVTGCDLPAVDPAFLASLVDAVGDRAGAIPVVEGHRRPLCAAYRVAPAHKACLAALVASDDALGDVLDRLDPVVVPEETVRERTDPTALRNVNTRRDLPAVERHVAAADERR